ncbi:LysR family transcriptional regulator [Vibrio sp. HN007]|uniref:LysR family transcriptional regulator n=1 Tax=Vibrio iocasae TaxID=3098914 RepID=UPI0035D486D9
MDQLSAMRTFIRVVQSGSFSAAAREQNTSQATISKKVAALENKLGVKLITRANRDHSLTEAGSSYYEHCMSVISEIDEMDANVRSQVSSPKGILRIAAPAPLGRIVLSPLIAEFLREYPDIEIDMSLEERHIDLIAEGIDVAIRARALDDSSMIARSLFENPQILVATPEYISKAGIPGTPIDLKRHNCIVYTLKKTRSNWHFNYDGKDIAVPVSGSFRSNNGETNLELALSGLGITQLPIWMVDEYLRTGKLIQVLKEYDAGNIPINAIYPQNRYVPLKVRCFIDFIRDRLKSNYA